MTNRLKGDWLDPTRDRLNTWAEWLKAGGNSFLSDAGLTASYKEYEDGGQGYVPQYEHPEAEAMDRILCKVRDRDRKAYDILFDSYYKNMSIRQIEQIRKISTIRVRMRLEQGETMAAVYWDALKLTG